MEAVLKKAEETTTASLKEVKHDDDVNVRNVDNNPKISLVRTVRLYQDLNPEWGAEGNEFIYYINDSKEKTNGMKRKIDAKPYRFFKRYRLNTTVNSDDADAKMPETEAEKSEV